MCIGHCTRYVYVECSNIQPNRCGWFVATLVMWPGVYKGQCGEHTRTHQTFEDIQQNITLLYLWEEILLFCSVLSSAVQTPSSSLHRQEKEPSYSLYIYVEVLLWCCSSTVCRTDYIRCVPAAHVIIVFVEIDKGVRPTVLSNHMLGCVCMCVLSCLFTSTGIRQRVHRTIPTCIVPLSTCTGLW